MTNYTMDANGDGLPDIVKSYDDGAVTKTFLINNESGWVNYTGFDLSETPVFTKKSGGNTYDQGVFFADLNNDGLVDLLQSYDDDGTLTKKSFINTGIKWTEKPLDLSSVPILLKKGKGLLGYRLADLDGDLAVDLIRSLERYIYFHQVVFKRCWLNTN